MITNNSSLSKSLPFPVFFFGFFFKINKLCVEIKTSHLGSIIHVLLPAPFSHLRIHPSGNTYELPNGLPCARFLEGSFFIGVLKTFSKKNRDNDCSVFVQATSSFIF